MFEITHVNITLNVRKFHLFSTNYRFECSALIFILIKLAENKNVIYLDVTRLNTHYRHIAAELFIRDYLFNDYWIKFVTFHPSIAV